MQRVERTALFSRGLADLKYFLPLVIKESLKGQVDFIPIDLGSFSFLSQELDV